MIDKSLILNNIKKHLSIGSGKDFAKYLDIKPTTLSMWYKRNTFDIELVFKKCEFINANYLLTGTGEMLKKYSDTNNQDLLKEDTIEYLTPENNNQLPIGAIPFYNLPVSAGNSAFEIDGSISPDGYIKDLPGTASTEAFLPVKGYSMLPEVKEGAIIGVRKINNWDSLNTERKYLIITQDDRMVKYIEHDDVDNNVLWCLSPNYKSFKIFKEDIIEIHRVTFALNPE